jgi:undecaprenyl-phosphate galactose phosphotransferase/putative colanic acid biosynthesis UDP-glucose lipid carrier transferase
LRHSAVLRLVTPSAPPSSQRQTATAPIYGFAKRCLDIVAASVLLLLCAPLLVAAAAAIRLESSGPALFRQWRLGKNGKPFRILKLRSLTVIEDGDVRQVTKNDLRLTRLGAILRKLSIDELPQLINVIRGEMSLVGPRPHAIVHDHYYAGLIDGYAERQNVKPGITGWAQIHGYRGETAIVEDMRGRVRLDIWYVRRAGFLLDLQILLATPGAVLRGRNAW